MWSLIEAAGWPIWPLIIASVVAMALMIERGLSLRDEKIIPATLLGDVLAQARRPHSQEAITKLAQHSPLGLVLSAGLACPYKDKAHLQDAMESAGKQAAEQLEKFLPILSMIASIAPLMGLLGTVIGMIEIFGAQNAVGNDPQALAHGISVALYNTAFGLIVAIPAAISHRIYRVKVDGQIHRLERAALALLDVLIAKPVKSV